VQEQVKSASFNPRLAFLLRHPREKGRRGIPGQRRRTPEQVGMRFTASRRGKTVMERVLCAETALIVSKQKTALRDVKQIRTLIIFKAAFLRQDSRGSSFDFKMTRSCSSMPLGAGIFLSDRGGGLRTADGRRIVLACRPDRRKCSQRFVGRVRRQTPCRPWSMR